MWQPWIGNNFDPRRLLILGESFYNWKDETTGEWVKPPADMPREVAECAMADPAHPISRTVDRITQMICGCQKPTPEQSSKAWQSIAYINYVPNSVGEGPKPRPTREDWNQALAEWPQLLDTVKPKIVIVLGYAMWKRMDTVIPMGNDKIGGYRLKDGSVAVCWAFRHPTAIPSWTWLRYVEELSIALQKTSSLLDNVTI